MKINNKIENINMKNKVIDFLKKNNVSFVYKNGFIKTNRTKIKIPEINEKIAYLYGVICGDGCLHKPIKNRKGAFRFRITITIQSEEFKKFVSKLVLKEFNYKTTHHFHRNHYDLYLTSAAIFAYFHELGIPHGKKYGKLKIPKEIKKDKILFYNFIAGLLDTDGSFDSSFYLSQKDFNFLLEIIEMGRKFNLEISELKSSPFKLPNGDIYDRRYIRIKKNKFLNSLLNHPRFINMGMGR